MDRVKAEAQTRETALARLAERLGIEPEFRDASGEPRRPTASVQRSLLRAMGVKAEHLADVERALDELERADWAEPIRAAVIRETSPLAVPLTLPSDAGEIRWSVDAEHGESYSGAVRFADLELVAHRGDLERRRLVVDAPLPAGYHRLTVAAHGAAPRAAALIVVPERCWLPEPIVRGERVWGLTTQLYGLRSARNWGIGDFTDLAELARIAGRLGADTIGLNPLHAAFPRSIGTPSPYSPASRLFLNVLYIDVTAVPDLAACGEAQHTIGSSEHERAVAACRDAELVDYAAVERLKLPLLEKLFETFEREAPPHRHAAFETFRAEGGRTLERFALWQALSTHLAARDPELGDWHRWPPEYRDAGSPAIVRFAQRNRQRVRFFEWLQWIAGEQLREAARVARESGVSLGLYRDLAVGADACGAEAWSGASLFAAHASVGAPADLFNPAGQDWGLPPLDPHALHRDGYAAFIELIRANMRHAGGLRIDHAMGLMRQYWVARGQSAADGAYVRYPLDELVGIIALESVRNRCFVVGEDLGTVPEGFRERMSERGILSYRILTFEQDEDGRLIAPEAYPPLALAAVGSHDLAPLKGWWEGRDIELKAANGLYPSEAAHREQRDRRAEDRARLIESLELNGIELPDGFGAESPYDASMAVAVHAFLARTRAALAVIQLEDLVEDAELVNLPGCVEGYPSWRRRLPVALEQLQTRPLVTVLASLFEKIRSVPRA